MKQSRDRIEGEEVIHISTGGVSVSMLATTGRIIEMQNTSTGRGMLRWNPMMLHRADASRADIGGIGETNPDFECLHWEREENAGKVIFHTTTLDGIEYARIISIDRCWVLIELVMKNDSDDVVSFNADQLFDTLVSFGGPVPKPPTGIAHNRQKITLKRRNASDTDEVYHRNSYDLAERVRDVEWLAVTDATTDEGLVMFTPPGIIDIHTNLSMRFCWQQNFVLPPGREWTTWFRMTPISGLHTILHATPRLAVGTCGERMVPPNASEECLRAVNLGPHRRVKLAGGFTGKMSVNAEQLEAFEFAVPLPDGPGVMPLRVEIDGHPLPVSVIKSGQITAVKDKYRTLCASCAEGGGISQSKYATLLSFGERFDFTRGMKPDAQLLRMRKLLSSAERVARNPEDVCRYYTEDDLDKMKLLAGSIDIDGEVDRFKELLDRPFEIPRPMHRSYDEAFDAIPQAEQLAPAVCLYALTQDEELAELIVKRLMTFAHCWRQFGCIRHETIHNALILVPVMLATDTLSRFGKIESKHETFVQAFIHDMIEQIERYQTRRDLQSSCKAMECAALATHAAIYPYYPGAGLRARSALDTFERLLTQGTLTDGCFWELSPDYHQSVTRSLCRIADARGRVGGELYRAPLAGRSLWEPANYIVQTLTAAGTLPRFEDSSGRVDTALLVDCAKRFEDGRFVSAAVFAGWKPSAEDLVLPAEIPKQEPIEHHAKCLEPSGRIILRSEHASLILDCGPHGGRRGHFDKLSFELHSTEGRIVPDPGGYHYEEAIHHNWFKASKSHNTVTLDDDNQQATCGQIVDFEDKSDVVRACCEANTYPGVTHMRVVENTGDTYTIADTLDGEIEGRRLVWRLNAFSPFSIAGATATADALDVDVLSDDVHIDVYPVEPIDGRQAWQLRVSKRANTNHEVFRVVLRPKIGNAQ